MEMLSSCRVVLASKSPRRQEILKNMGLNAEIRPSAVEENLEKKLYEGRLQDYAVDTATLKVNHVFNSLKDESLEQTLIVIGSDTIVTHNGKIYEKPADVEDAVRIISTLSGSTHTVFSGVSLVARGTNGQVERTTFFEGTDVEFAQLSEEVIRAYVATGEPFDKAGGYGIQACGCTLVKGISGDYFSVMGFPAHRFAVELTSLLKKMGLA